MEFPGSDLVFMSSCDSGRARWSSRLPGVFLLFFFLLGGNPAFGQSSSGWITGPGTVSLAGVSRLVIPPGYRFGDATSARIFLAAAQSRTDGAQVGVLLPPIEQARDARGCWFILFSYADVGHVSDEAGDALNSGGGGADVAMGMLKANIKQINHRRKSEDWPTMEIAGWERPPEFNSTAHALTWAIRTEVQGQTAAYYNTRVLGRAGYLSAKMVIPPEQLGAVDDKYRSVLAGLSFIPGQRYQDFHFGEKVAGQTLTQLITGDAPPLSSHRLAHLLSLFSVSGASILAASVLTAKTMRRWRGGPIPVPAV